MGRTPPGPCLEGPAPSQSQADFLRYGNEPAPVLRTEVRPSARGLHLWAARHMSARLGKHIWLGGGELKTNRHRY